MYSELLNRVLSSINWRLLSVELILKTSTRNDRERDDSEFPVPATAVLSVSRATGPSATTVGVSGVVGVPVIR